MCHLHILYPKANSEILYSEHTEPGVNIYLICGVNAGVTKLQTNVYIPGLRFLHNPVSSQYPHKLKHENGPQNAQQFQKYPMISLTNPRNILQY